MPACNLCSQVVARRRVLRANRAWYSGVGRNEELELDKWLHANKMACASCEGAFKKKFEQEKPKPCKPCAEAVREYRQGRLNKGKDTCARIKSCTVCRKEKHRGTRVGIDMDMVLLELKQFAEGRACP